MSYCVALYLCGSPDMIAEARKAFGALGASMEHLYADGFHFQHQGARGKAPARAVVPAG